MSKTDKRTWPRNPLVVAVEGNDYDEVRRLAAEGAELSEPDANDESPLWVAARDVRMIELLLQLGADPRVWAGVYSPSLVESCSPESEIGQLLTRYGHVPTGGSRYLRNLDRT